MKFICCLVLNTYVLFGSFRFLLSVLRSSFVAEFAVIIFNKYRQIEENYTILHRDRLLPHLLQFIIPQYDAV